MKYVSKLFCFFGIVAIFAGTVSAEVVNLVKDGKFQDITYVGSGETAGYGYLKNGGTVNGTLNQWTVANSDYYGAVNPKTASYELIGGTANYAGMVTAYGNVLFLQANKTSSAITATQTITGLEVGKTYYLSANVATRENGLNMGISLTGANDSTMVDWGTAGTYSINREAFLPVVRSFVATDTTATLTLTNNATNDDMASSGFQNLVISETRPTGWQSFARWSDDSPIVEGGTYTHALSFAQSGSSFSVKGTEFTTITGKAAVENATFSRTAAGEVNNNTVSVTGESSPLATGFVTMPVGSNTYTLKGLLPGFEYETTIFTNMWDTNYGRRAFITVNDETPFYVCATSYEGRTTTDGRQGTALVWAGQASDSGELKFDFAVNSNPFHVHGLANRVVSAPEGTLLAAAFGGTSGQTVIGKKVDTFNTVNSDAVWKVRGSDNKTTDAIYAEYNSRSALRLGPNTGLAVALAPDRLDTLDVHNFQVSVDICLGSLTSDNQLQYARGAGVGFFNNQVGLGAKDYVDRGFSGLVVTPDGGLYFYSNMTGGDPTDSFSEPIAYGEGWEQDVFHTLTFTALLSDDGTKATLKSLDFEGSTADYSALLGKEFETTALLGLSSSGSAGSKYSYFDNLVVTDLPEPATWALMVLGALGLLLLKKR